MVLGREWSTCGPVVVRNYCQPHCLCNCPPPPLPNSICNGGTGQLGGEIHLPSSCAGHTPSSQHIAPRGECRSRTMTLAIIIYWVVQLPICLGYILEQHVPWIHIKSEYRYSKTFPQIFCLYCFTKYSKSLRDCVMVH